MSFVNKRIFQPLTTLIVLLLLLMAASIPAHAADLNGVKNSLARATEQNLTEIDISAYGIPRSEFNDLYHEWSYKGSFPWYVQGFNYSYSSGIVTTVRPKYWDPSIYSRSLYERELNRILTEAVLPDMSDWQKALSLYNHLAAQTAYSESFPQTGGIQRNAYGAIVNKDAVCVGYAHAYMELLDRCGIKSVMVSSDAMNHTWNLVLIRGNWYHVDVTWGDPLVYGADANGRVNHNYFLLSDEAISDSDHNHHGWERFYSCPDTFFDTGTFWNDLNNHIWYMDDSVSFLRKSTNKEINIIRRDEYTAKQTVLCTVTPTVVNITGTSYYYANYGISLWNDMIYFSDAANVYAISPAGGEPTVVYAYNTTANKKVILGSYVRDDTIYLTLRNGANETEKFAVPLPYTYHTHNFQMRNVSSTCVTEGHTNFACSCGDSFNSGYLETIAHQAGSFTVTAEPRWDSPGQKHSSCVMCGMYMESAIPALSTVKGTFYDVPDNEFYTESVLWAYARGVTGGVSATSFAPAETCTRGQVVTFLWRKAGQPMPASSYNPFHDVFPSDYYYNAVLWAVEQGITQGTSASTFAPNDTCIRAQVVTFLWRAADCPTVSNLNSIPFTDIERNSYYTPAMVWALENGITSGTSATTFAPNDSCTRAQVVTFLYRTVFPVHRHSYTLIETVDATCKEDGYTLMQCTCGDSCEESIPMTDTHDLTEIDYAAPTYTAEGYRTMQCVVCRSVFVERIDMLPIPEPSPEPTFEITPILPPDLNAPIPVLPPVEPPIEEVREATDTTNIVE